MEGAILEVLLVSAEGIDPRNILGKRAYHVIIECGTQTCRSKTSSENHDKIYWNEKFTLELPTSELETLNHLKLKIVDDEYFSGGEFIGQTTIFLKGVILEADYRGIIEMNPATYNIVLVDDSYHGQMTVGLKFTPNVMLPLKRTQDVQEENSTSKSIYKTIISFWQMRWWRLFFSCRNRVSANKLKKK